VAWSTESVCDVSGEIEKIAIGEEAGCWLTADGEIDCWGLNRYPNQGSGLATDIAAGVIHGHPTGYGYRDVDIAYYHACAVDQSGCIECWGDYENNYRAGNNNGGGAPGTGSGTNAHPGSCDFESVVVGENHSCGLKDDGTVHCWGWNNPSGVISDTPPTMPPTMTFSKLSAYTNITCGVQDTNGGLHCWGNSSDFMDSSLGSPSFALKDLEVTNSAACGIKEADGEVVCWGYDIPSWNRTGRFPNTFADPLPAIYDASGVAIAGFGACAVNGTGQIQSWGHASYIPATPGVYQDVAGGWSHICGLTAYGRVQCWGDDGAGETNPPNH
jgi:alpha-tubulin suppressor-like RCC1 family protein